MASYLLNNARKIRRIHVTGGPGMGKTTLATDLARTLGVPKYDVDAIGYVNKGPLARPLDARLADIRRIVRQRAWVTETSHLRWTDELLEAADVILWLDHIPWFVAVGRVLRRYFHNGLELEAGAPNVAKITNLSRYPEYLRSVIDIAADLVWTWQYYCSTKPTKPLHECDDTANNLRTTAGHLARYSHKVVRCRSTSELRAALTGIVGAI